MRRFPKSPRAETLIQGILSRRLIKPAALAATERNLETAAELMGETGSCPSALPARGGRYRAVSRGYARYETAAARLADAMRDLGVPLEESGFCSLHHACSPRGR